MKRTAFGTKSSVIIISRVLSYQSIGIWGQQYARYLKQHHKVLYMNLLTSGNLSSYLVDINEQAKEMFSRLAKQMAGKQVITGKLKAENQMEWILRMNHIQACAREIVNSKLIYT